MIDLFTKQIARVDKALMELGRLGELSKIEKNQRDHAVETAERGLCHLNIAAHHRNNSSWWFFTAVWLLFATSLSIAIDLFQSLGFPQFNYSSWAFFMIVMIAVAAFFGFSDRSKLRRNRKEALEYFEKAVTTLQGIKQ